MTDRTRSVAHGLLVAALCTAFLFGWGGVPQVNDEHLYLPIARAVADPGLFPAGDLVVSSGLRGPFFMYRLAGALYANGLNIDAWWLAAYVMSLVALFAAIWWVARAATAGTVVAAAVTAIIAAASPYRGTLHWFLLPPPNFVVSTLALPALVSAVALAISGRRGPGLLLAAATFNLHPSMGLIIGGGIGVMMLIDARAAWKPLVPWFAAAVALALPTAMFVAGSTPGNFAAPDPTAFRTVLRTYSYHAFPADHWREGYGFFLLSLGLAVRVGRGRAARDLLVLAAWTVLLMVASVANLATLDVISVDLLFLFRGASFAKLAAWVVIATGLHAAWRDADARDRARVTAVSLLVVLAALVKNDVIGEGLLAVACGASLILFRHATHSAHRTLAIALVALGAFELLAPGWGALHVAPFAASRVDSVKLLVIGAAAAYVVTAPFAGWMQAPHEAERTAAGPTARVIGVAVAVFALALLLRGRVNAFTPASPATIAARAHLAEPDPDLRGVIAWAAKTPRGSLIAVPPLDDRFSVIRLAAGRGLYIEAAEVIQVAYDVAAAAEAHRRVLALGTRVNGPHRLDASAYDRLSADSVAAIARDGVDFAVFGARTRAALPLALPVAYQDSLWIAYDVRSKR